MSVVELQGRRRVKELTRQVGSARHVLHEAHADIEDSSHTSELVYGRGDVYPAEQLAFMRRMICGRKVCRT